MTILRLFGLLLALPLLPHATSYLPPQLRDVYSPDGSHFVRIDPLVSSYTIYATSVPGTPIWSFSRSVWHDRVFITNDGLTVIWVNWPFIGKGKAESRQPGVTIYKRSGAIHDFSHRLLSKPRKYRKREVGPVGSSWRVWIENAWQTDTGVMIVTPPEHRKLHIDATSLAITKG